MRQADQATRIWRIVNRLLTHPPGMYRNMAMPSHPMRVPNWPMEMPSTSVRGNSSDPLNASKAE